MDYHNPFIWRKLIGFFLITFWYLDLHLSPFFSPFVLKRSNDFFTIKITNNIYLWNSIFNFLDQKNLFRLIFSAVSRKSIFVFWYSHMIANFKFKIFIVLYYFHSLIGVFQIYLLLTLTTHRKNLTLVLYLLVNYISSRNPNIMLISWIYFIFLNFSSDRLV